MPVEMYINININVLNIIYIKKNKNKLNINNLILGNESADRLADMVVEHGGTAMDRTDILNVLKYDYIISRAAIDFETTTIIRLNELHVKADSARQQQYAGKERRIVNQHNTGCVSRYTFTYTFKEKSAHLWMCPMYNENDLMTKIN
jgi:hypothetical protein